MQFLGKYFILLDFDEYFYLLVVDIEFEMFLVIFDGDVD